MGSVASIRNFIKKETVLILAGLIAALSAVFVPPSSAYLGYIDGPVLVLLFCLMAVVAGFKKTGVFEWLSQAFLTRTANAKFIGLLLVLLCFFASMFITNDVALITFVPLTMGLFSNSREDRLIFVIVLETVAANLGSLVTPIGNPQNLYLFSVYDMDIGPFLRITLPLGLISLASIVLIVGFFMRPGTIRVLYQKNAVIDKINSLKYLLLFLLCLLTVLKILNIWICFGIVILVLLLTDRRVIGKVDYALLLTFVFFFVFVGNISQIDRVSAWISALLTGRVMVVSALVSQVISNVPAAVMLSSFTDDAKALILGTNIGGLGTPVASLASLISYKLYCTGKTARKGRYLILFGVVNFMLLAFLLLIAGWIY